LSSSGAAAVPENELCAIMETFWKPANVASPIAFAVFYRCTLVADPDPNPKLVNTKTMPTRSFLTACYTCAVLGTLSLSTLSAQTKDKPAPVSTTSSPTSLDGQILELPTFEVKTDKDTDYRANNAVSSNRFNTPLKDTPQSVTVLTEAFLKDLEVIDINQALVYVPGVKIDTYGAANDDGVQIRGQPTPEHLLDSMPDITGNFRPDPATLERVEVIQGSSSSLYGSSWPGGIINLILEDNKVRFEVNVDAAKQADLNISSRLLALAKIVPQSPVDGRKAE